MSRLKGASLSCEEFGSGVVDDFTASVRERRAMRFKKGGVSINPK